MPRDATRELEVLLSQLAEQVSPRLAGSPSEATVAALINGRLRRAGMGVATYPIRVVVRTGGAYVVLGALGLIAAALSPLLPLPSLLLALGVLAWLGADSLGASIPPLGRRSLSQTIIGVRAIEGASGLEPRVPRWRVVLLAPLDSALEWPGLLALAGPGRRSTLGRLSAAALVALGAALALLLPGLWWLVGLPGALGCLLLSVAALGRPCATQHDSGLVALAALLSTAQRLKYLHMVEFWTAAVGASCADPRGFTTLLTHLPFDQERTVFIALEQLTGDHLALVLPTGTNDALLCDLVAAAVAADPSLSAVIGPYPPPIALAPPLRRHGYRTLSIVARSVAGNAPAPAAGGPDLRLVEQVTQLLIAMVARLEQGEHTD
jgi:hypothetical protein